MVQRDLGSMRIGFIGAGQMARALARGLVTKGHFAPCDITVADCSSAALTDFRAVVPQTNVTQDNGIAAAQDIVVLAVKPQNLSPILHSLAPLDRRVLVVSIVAGVKLERLCRELATERVVRVMPNTPALVLAGAAGICRAPGADDTDVATVTRIFEAVGRCWELPEPLLDAVTGLSGSGPAFVFQFIEALSDGGVNMGLPRQVAQELAAQTVLGSAQMLLETGEHPAVLKDRVASPAGTTMAGLQALEAGAFRGVVMSAVRAATERCRTLGQ
jgi:pyrroline-5-carboxylate reductase